jgi:hypothetical protein
MMNYLRIFLFVIVQALVVSRIQLFDGLVLPFIYIFSLLMFPFDTPRWLLLLIGFFTGILMDLFTGPPGLHTSACLLLAFLQPLVQNMLAPREGYDSNLKPTIHKMGLLWYTTYAGILTLVHHTWLIFFEFLRWDKFFFQLFHILLSSIATLLLMILAQLLISPDKKSS